MKRYILFILFLATLLFSANSSQGEDIFTASVDLKKLIADSILALDPTRHSIILFEVKWKDKFQKELYPITAVQRSMAVAKGTNAWMYYVNSNKYGYFGKESFYKIAESDTSVLYMFCANTLPDNFSFEEQGILSEAPFGFGLIGFLFDKNMLTFKREDITLTLAYPIQKGSIHYIGTFHLEDMTQKELVFKMPVSVCDEITVSSQS